MLGSSRAVFQMLLPSSILDYWTICVCKSRGRGRTAPAMRQEEPAQSLSSRLLFLGPDHQETSWVRFCPCLCRLEIRKLQESVLSTYTYSTTIILPTMVPAGSSSANCLQSRQLPSFREKKFEADVHVAIFIFFYQTLPRKK